jgi:hypothetical protein
MDFSLSQYGTVFSTRPRGLDIRESLQAELPPGDTVIISFASVNRVSQSFSDEFLGALISELGSERVRVEGAITPSVERVLNRALRHRGLSGIDEVAAVAA